MKRTSALAVGALVAAGIVLAPTPAHAAPSGVWIDGSTMHFASAPGIANTLTISDDTGPAFVRFSDPANLIGAVTPCESVTKYVARCPTAGILSVHADLADLNDYAVNRGVRATTLMGGAGTDILVANGGRSHALDGGPGDDTLYATAKLRDTFIGGPGTDTVTYAARTAPVKVTLDNLYNDGDIAGAESDNVASSVENVIGGTGNDSLTGSAVMNVLSGGVGNDTLNGGYGHDRLDGGLGADSMVGGPGVDWVTYASRTQPVTASISPTIGGDGVAGENDTVGTSVEVLIGGSGDDRLTGSNVASETNQLIGNAGNDRLSGLAGTDYLSGGAGNDHLNGGAGADACDGGAGTNTLVSC